MVTYSSSQEADEFTSQLDGFTIKGGRAEGNGGTFDTALLETFGGGLVLHGPVNVAPTEKAKPVIARCTFTGNHGDQGGGVHIRGFADAHFLACSFITNIAREGAGLHVEPDLPTPPTGDEPEATLVNCLLAGNLSQEHGGGIVSGGPALRLTNCTVALNEAEITGGGVWIELGSSVTIHNSILWGNIRGDETPDQILEADGEALVSYSDVQGDWSGTGNIDEDSEFVNPVLLASFRLQDISPAIDAGDLDEMAILPDSFDIDHDVDDEEPTPDRDMRDRIRNGPDGENVVAVDMGAYEFHCPWDCDGSADGNVNVSDLLALLAQYDPLAPNVCDGGESCDYDGNGCVDVTDLLALLAHYADLSGVGCPGGSDFGQQGLQAIIENESLLLSESWIEILNEMMEAEGSEEE